MPKIKLQDSNDFVFTQVARTVIHIHHNHGKSLENMPKNGYVVLKWKEVKQQTSRMIVVKFISIAEPCDEEGAVRVFGVPGNRLVGRLEICVNSEWGTVCDDGFDANAAIVACRQLGVEGKSITHTHTHTYYTVCILYIV